MPPIKSIEPSLGVFGGTFDPIHYGHLLTAEVVADQLQLPQILFVPSGDPPHKQDRLKTPPSHRARMVELAIANNPRFVLDRTDLDRPGPHYSVETIPLIKQRYQLTRDTCWFIIGADSLHHLPRWYNTRTLIEQCRFAVVNRAGYQPDVTALSRELPGLTETIAWVEMPLIEISSSAIRHRVREQRSVRYWLADAVHDYITYHSLYTG